MAKDLEHIVGLNADTNTITFTEDELIPKGTRHVKSLYIVVECHEMIISRVLIDKGSVLNIYIVVILGRIRVEDLMFCLNGMIYVLSTVLKPRFVEK